MLYWFYLLVLLSVLLPVLLVPLSALLVLLLILLLIFCVRWQLKRMQARSPYKPAQQD